MEVLSCLDCLTELEIDTRIIPDNFSLQYCPVCQSDNIEIEFIEGFDSEDD